MAQLVKNPPAVQETWVRSLDWEEPLEKGKATHSSIPAYSLENSMDRIVLGVAESRTRLSNFICLPLLEYHLLFTGQWFKGV